MKRCKAEYLFKDDSPQIFDLSRLTFKRLSGLSEEMFTMHTLHAFGWIFLCHLEGCDSINFIDKKFPYFILSYYLE